MTQENKDIQSQVKPYIVKSHDIHIDVDYADWIADTNHSYLFCAENMGKQKLLDSMVDVEKMHQAGAELSFEKLQQIVGELQFAVNYGLINLKQVCR